MNIVDLIRSFKREDVEAGIYKNERPLIILPSIIYDQTKEICKNSNESRGILLNYNADNSSINVCGMIPFAQEEQIDTQYEPRKLKALKQLLRERRDLSPLGYQTDTDADNAIISCIKFDSDHELMLSLRNHPDYKHLIFTPNEIVTLGSKRPYIAVEPISQKILQEMSAITRRFETILDYF